MGFIDYLQAPGTLNALRTQLLEHVVLALTVVVAGVLISVTLGVLAHRVPALRELILNTSSVLLTIPSLALFALLLPVVGIGFAPAAVGLTLYSFLPIVRNTVSGLQSVDSAVVESARGMGMSASGRLLKIELPNAWPVILAGIRVATQLIIGIAATAALVGGPGLGQEIFRGIRSIGSVGALNSLIAGTLGIVLVAAAFDLVYVAIGRLTIPKGIR